MTGSAERVQAPATRFVGATVVPGGGDARVYAPGELWVRGGVVEAVGSEGDCARPSRAAAEQVELRGKIIMPGLINAHAHSYGALLKGSVDALPLDLYMLHVIEAGTGRTPREVYVSTLVDCIGMLRTGTTAVIDHFSHPRRGTVGGQRSSTTRALDESALVHRSPQQSSRVSAVRLGIDAKALGRVSPVSA